MKKRNLLETTGKSDTNKSQISVNFTNPRWGHACSIDSYKKNNFIVCVSGHSSKYFDIGDHIIFKSQAKNPFGFRYKVIKIEWMRDPSDMFFATCLFANIQTSEVQREDAEHIKLGHIYWETTPTNSDEIIKIIEHETGTKINLKKWSKL